MTPGMAVTERLEIRGSEDVVRVRQRVRALGSSLASNQRPCSEWPSSAAKHAPESKRGQQSQSIEPARDTSAAVSQSPMSA